MDYAVAVIDIGMTNKKVAVYDQNLRQLDAAYKNFEPMQIPHPVTGDELDVHDLQGMKDWFFATLKEFAQKYPIKAISVTTHGATFVCLDKAGRECTPCIFYTYEPGPEFQKEFYETVGQADELQREIYTPPFSSMINPAKGIFFLQKYFHESFQHTDCILNYPQYWGYILTGNKGVEPTYISNHSYLWNHREEAYSQVTEKLGIKQLLPENYRNTYEALGTLTPQVAQELGLPESTIVTMGIHDSNASLLPYLAKDSHGDFILNSTGTWCVSMHPQGELSLNPEDVGKIVYFTQTALRTPVKIAIFLGGMEFDTYISLYKEIAHTDQFPSYNPEAFNAVLQEKDTFLLPEVVPGSGQYTTSKPGILEKGKFHSLEDIKTKKSIPELFKNPERLLAVLDISLVIQTITALQRAGMKEGTNIFTEGGFRKNKGYNQLLASALNNHSVQLTNMEEATAFGAAMTGVMALENKSHKDLADTITIEYTDVEKFQFPEFESYQGEWIKLAIK